MLCCFTLSWIQIYPNASWVHFSQRALLFTVADPEHKINNHYWCVCCQTKQGTHYYSANVSNADRLVISLVFFLAWQYCTVNAAGRPAAYIPVLFLSGNQLNHAIFQSKREIKLMSGFIVASLLPKYLCRSPRLSTLTEPASRGCF